MATWRPAGGAIRVVLVDDPKGWVAFFCTDITATVADILECMADRLSLEITCRDVKEVVGAGQQQVRFVRGPGKPRVTESAANSLVQKRRNIALVFNRLKSHFQTHYQLPQVLLNQSFAQFDHSSTAVAQPASAVDHMGVEYALRIAESANQSSPSDC